VSPLSAIVFDESREQIELLLNDLVEKEQGFKELEFYVK
jgi:hypothetical protein